MWGWHDEFITSLATKKCYCVVWGLVLLGEGKGGIDSCKEYVVNLGTGSHTCAGILSFSFFNYKHVSNLSHNSSFNLLF